MCIFMFRIYGSRFAIASARLGITREQILFIKRVIYYKRWHYPLPRSFFNFATAASWSSV